MFHLKRVLGCIIASSVACHTHATTGTTDSKPSSAEATSAATTPSADGKGEPNKLQIVVDPRVELFAIIERLAKIAPFVDSKGVYVNDVDATFGRFANHPAVLAAQKLRQTNGISYNAPIDLAIHVDPSLRPLLPLAPLPSDLDARWKTADASAFLFEVNRFSADTPFKDFIAKHAAFYRAVEEKFREYTERTPIVGWFEKTFEPRANASFHLAPSQLVGTFNFGLRAKDASGNESVVVVMNFQTDANAKPNFTLGDVAHEVIAHEVGHSFVNPIVDAHFSALEPVATALLATQKAAMDKLTYGNPSAMTRESVNRAVVLLFLGDRSTPAHRDKTMNEEVQRGFVWTPKLVSALADVRKKNAGKLPADAVAQTTQRVFQAWLDNP